MWSSNSYFHGHFLPLRYFLTMECLSGVFYFYFFFLPFQDCIFPPSTQLSAIPCEGSVHTVSRSPLEGFIPYVVVYLLCLWEDVSSGLPFATEIFAFYVFSTFVKNIFCVDRQIYF